MATTVTWKISTLDRRTSDGYVFQAHWTCSGVDGDYSGSVYSTCGWSEGQPTIPYANLTQQQVLGWIWAAGVNQQATEAAVQQQIDNQINPPITQPALPWATQTEAKA